MLFSSLSRGSLEELEAYSGGGGGELGAQIRPLESVNFISRKFSVPTSAQRLLE